LRTFFLFYLLASLFRNPLLALLVVGAVLYFSEARYSGRYFNPARTVSKRRVIGELERRIRTNPYDADARNDLGRLLCEEGRSAEALEHLEKAIERMNESAETHYFLGRSLLETGHGEQGVSHIQEALRISPNFAYGEPWVTLARHYLKSSKPVDAVEAAKHAVRTNTSSVEGWVLLGKAHEALGQRDDAAAAYASAMEAFTDLPRYLKLSNRRWRSRARAAARALG